MRKSLLYYFKKQKGVTFLEILAVLVILVLIYLAYARSFGAGTDKTKISDVQNSFKQYQIGFENSLDEASGLPSSNGINIDYATLNKYLNKDFQIASPTNGTGSIHPTANPIQTSRMKDPWNNNYMIQAKNVSPSESLLLVRSAGKDKQNTVTTDLFYDTQNGTDKDDILFITYFKSNTAKSCTKGLSKDLGSANISGTGLSSVFQDVPASLRQPKESLYQYEYAIDATIFVYAYGTTQSARTYLFSNIPLNLSITNNGGNITESSGLKYDGFNVWYLHDDGYGGTVGDFYSTPNFFTNSTLGGLPADATKFTKITDVSGGVPSQPNTILGCK